MVRIKLRKISWYDIIGVTILSLCTTAMTRSQFNGVWGTIEDNYFTKFGISSIVLFMILGGGYLIGISFVDFHFEKFFERLSLCEQEQNKKKIIGTWAVIIFISWIPYYLSYYPGGVFADTFTSISYVTSGILTNRHPVCYTMVMGMFMHIGDMLNKDLTWSIGFFTAVQMLVLEIEFLYFVSWMLRQRVNRYVRIVSSLFIVFFPLIPLYAISVWKDTPFCMAVFFWMMFVVDLYLEALKGKIQVKTLVRFVIGVFLVAFTRNNGIYIVSLFVLVWVLLFFKKIRKEKKYLKVAGVEILTVIVIYLIQGPGYNIMGIAQTKTVENFGIPLQQIGAVVSYEGSITEEQKQVINKFIPYENIKEHYSPALVDNLKWYAGLNEQYMSEHIFEFLELWFSLLKQNPLIYVRAYLMETLGFWNVDVSTADGYVQNFIWGKGKSIEMHDYFLEWFGFSFQHFVNPRHTISCAWFFWAFFITAWFSMKHYGKKTVILFMPQLGTWMTLMIATPIAVSLRYIAANMFTLPFVVIVPILLVRDTVTEN